MKLLKLKAYSLVELMVVIAIVGILVGIGVPSYRAYVSRSEVAKAIPMMPAISKEVEDFYAKNTRFPTPTEIGYSADGDWAAASTNSGLTTFSLYGISMVSNTDPSTTLRGHVDFAIDTGAVGLEAITSNTTCRSQLLWRLKFSRTPAGLTRECCFPEACVSNDFREYIPTSCRNAC